MVRFYTPESVPHRTKEYLGKLVALFAEFRVNEEEFDAVRRRTRESEFAGTAFAPLPDESALIRIIREVQSGQAVNHQHHAEPMRPATETRQEQYGVIIAGDGEKIVRDRYFFRDMVRAGAIFGSTAYPEHWVDEAVSLMDDGARGAYRAAQTPETKHAVMEAWYRKLELAPRRAVSPDELEKRRQAGILQRIPWSRYETPNQEPTR